MTYQNRLNTKILTLLTALYLVAGCSSGSAGGGAGAANTGITDDGVIFSATVNPDGISVDTVLGICTPGSVSGTGVVTLPVIEPGLFTKIGTLTISAQSTTALVDPSLFPSGVTFNGYTVSYAKQSGSQAPTLSPRQHAQSITLISGTSSVTAQVTLFDLGTALREFRTQNPTGNVYSYRVSVTANGQTLAGKPIILTATTFLEIGNFNLCTSTA